MDDCEHKYSSLPDIVDQPQLIEHKIDNFRQYRHDLSKVLIRDISPIGHLYRFSFKKKEPQYYSYETIRKLTHEYTGSNKKVYSELDNIWLTVQLIRLNIN